MLQVLDNSTRGWDTSTCGGQGIVHATRRGLTWCAPQTLAQNGNSAAGPQGVLRNETALCDGRYWRFDDSVARDGPFTGTRASRTRRTRTRAVARGFWTLDPASGIQT